jgi:prepilin-type N-terminal cleavage/methylation domain-containing protein/prepilin-type processing-associated H-X9-DG protein
MKRPGYTLVELLVVLGIIGVASAIVFPVFAQTRKRAHRTACLSNLRQIGLAIQQYVQDNDGQYPMAGAGSGASGYWWSDAVRPYLKDRQVLWCPSVTRNRQANYPNWDSGYVYNINRLETLMSHDPVLNTGRERSVHENKFVNLANIIVVNDGAAAEYRRWVEVPNCRSTDLFGKPVTTLGYATLHLDGSNFLFGDGHVKWHTPEAAAQIECSEAP